MSPYPRPRRNADIDARSRITGFGGECRIHPQGGPTKFRRAKRFLKLISFRRRYNKYPLGPEVALMEVSFRTNCRDGDIAGRPAGRKPQSSSKISFGVRCKNSPTLPASKR